MQILPSYHASTTERLASLELAPFRGLRYAPDRVSGLAEVTSPPYDVIFSDKEDQLMAADPHNVVRLILPRPVDGEVGGGYGHAAQSLREWREQQILVTDPDPALYVYEQAGPAMVQRGLIGAVRLVPPEAGVVLPHEDVSPGPVAGRLRLMTETQANLEPIFLLYDGGDGEPGPAARIIARTAETAPLMEAHTSDGLRHRLWAITDPGEVTAIADDLAPRQALIADGHHRYAAYLRLQEDMRRSGAGEGPWDYGLALLVDSAGYPPRIGAIHRVISGLDATRAAELASTAFRVREASAAIADLPVTLEALADVSAAGPAFAVIDKSAGYLLTDPDPARAQAAMPPGTSPQWRALPASVMQELLIFGVWELTDDDQAVLAVHDAEAAVRAAQARGGTAVLCSPMTPADVYAVAARGEKVPRKSTSFAPKPRTGLVMRAFADG
ncbi:MAG: DUF1015 family protein [Streptosporangiaceae bacterium]